MTDSLTFPVLLASVDDLSDVTPLVVVAWFVDYQQAIVVWYVPAVYPVLPAVLSHAPNHVNSYIQPQIFRELF